MSSDTRQTLQPGSDIGPQVTQGQLLRGQIDNARASPLLISLITPQAHAQFFCCTLLCPAHALSPEPQLKTTHIDTPHIFRNSPGEILTHYENIALFAVCSGGWHGR